MRKYFKKERKKKTRARYNDLQFTTLIIIVRHGRCRAILESAEWLFTVCDVSCHLKCLARISSLYNYVANLNLISTFL